MSNEGPEYVGFWARTGAAFIDTIVLLVAIAPVLAMLGMSTELNLDPSGMPILDAPYWHGVTSQTLLGAAIIIGFWVWKSATPGKMVIGAVIVDADTLGRPTTGQLIGRYLGYFVSLFPCGLGLLWVALDKRKQGWHDKLAGTVVIKKGYVKPQ